MSSVKTWRRAALSAYIAAGAALPLAAYALATTQANVNAIAAVIDRRNGATDDRRNGASLKR